MVTGIVFGIIVLAIVIVAVLVFRAAAKKGVK